MLQRRKILISFLAITVLQGITYPAIALGSESNAMQVSSNSKLVVPEKLRTLDHGRPWSDDQFASTRLSSNRDMSR